MLGELKRHFRDKGWSVYVPRGAQKRAMALTRETERLAKRLGRSPGVREVAESLSWSVEETLEAREAANSYEAASLDAPAGPDEDANTLVETLGTDDPSYELVRTATRWPAAGTHWTLSNVRSWSCASHGI